jgi:hypothetical protein
MKKLCSSASALLDRIEKRRKMQYGGSLGFPGYNPYDNPLQRFSDVARPAVAGYLSNYVRASAILNQRLDDPELAERRAQASSIATGAIYGAGAYFAQRGQDRDFAAYEAKLARRKAMEYNRVPYDRYAYNEYLDNPYGATAYKHGGRYPKKYQYGGETIDPQEYPQEYPNYDTTSPVQEQVVFDSTPPDEANGWGGWGEPLDEMPYYEDGTPNLAGAVPTLGNISHVRAAMPDLLDATVQEIGLQESGGNYGAVNRTGGTRAINATGKYQFVPKYWHRQIAEHMGITGSQETVMEAFKKSPEAQESFMRHVVDTIYMPEVKRLLPAARQYGIGTAELVKMLHYRGVQDTRQRISTGNFETPKRERELYNNPDILTYIKGKR